ncbi:hypothetical protein KJ684_03470, partial [Patescibacteria group bacterium]|nr:hypothetical protein [Patescibacteria group bacterium]
LTPDPPVNVRNVKSKDLTLLLRNVKSKDLTLLPIDDKGNMMKNSSGKPEVIICNFELIWKISDTA